MEEKGMPDLIGQTVEHYQIVAQVSQSDGEVNKACAAKFDRTVGLSVLENVAAQDQQGEYVLKTRPHCAFAIPESHVFMISAQQMS
jgi:hypothetical protein